MSRSAIVVGLLVLTVLDPQRGVAQFDVMGKWDEVEEWPLQTIHAILLKNGKVL